MGGNIRDLISKRDYNSVVKNMRVLGLSRNNDGIITLKELAKLVAEVFAKCVNVGEKTIEEINQILKNKN